MIWYVGYGSNLDRERFLRYLTGGRPPGAQRSVPGARDATPPQDERAVTVPGRMVFGWTSPTWGGGVSFLDAHGEALEDTALGRAYLLTEQPLADVAAQEMHAEPGADLDLARVLEHRRDVRGPGRYETLHLLGELDGSPLLTFTAEDPAALGRNAPSSAYLLTVARGLRATHALSDAEIAEHLATRPGAAPWTPETVLDLLTREG